MTAPRWKLLAAPVMALAVVAPLVASCGSQPAGPHTAAAGPSGKGGPAPVPYCEEFRYGDFSQIQFDAPQEEVVKIKSLLLAAHLLGRGSIALEEELIAACSDLAKAAGAFDEELKIHADNGKGAEKACAIAAAKTTKVLTDAKNAKIEVTVEPDTLHCFSDVETTRKCLVECGAPTPRDDVRASCTGGEIDGLCKGHCGGTCAVEAGECTFAECNGICKGKCDKDFRGYCAGKCNGTCNGAATHGPHRCVGTCNGACSDGAEGACAGHCDGTCSAEWAPRDPGRCPGLCIGQCGGGEIEQPMCSGEFNPPGVEGICLAACAGRGALAARCTTPWIKLTQKGKAHRTDLEKLLAGIQIALPRILRVQQGAAKRLPRAMERVSAAAIEWSNAYATSGARPLFCVHTAIEVMKAAAEGIDTAVKGTLVVQPALKTAEPPPPPPKPVDDQ
jgi:hypothetical protein